MKDIDLSYLAGYIDADGCISLSKNNTMNNAYQLTIAITSTKPKILYWILDLLKVGYVKEIPFYKSQTSWVRGRKQKQYIWRISNRGIRKIIKLLIPFLKTKKRQAELINEYLEISNKRKGKYITEEDRIKKHLIYQEMKILNKRGV
jgi:hypothetical protein